jgi:ATP adenylyltransferase
MSDQSLSGGAGMPDSWQRLWAPHRMSYLEGENRPLAGNEIECPFCRIASLDDAEALIVARGKEAYVVMNLYPYNAGHLLVCTNRHVAELPELTESERNEVQSLTAQGMKVLRKVSNASGFNIGINQGDVSGAGIAGHFHQHIVPRWAGDANFMPIIGKTKVIPKLLQESREQLAAGWNQI